MRWIRRFERGSDGRKSAQSGLFVEVLAAAIDAEIVILRGAAAAHTDARDQLGAAVEAFVRRALAGPALAYAFIAEHVDPEVDAERIRGRRRFGEVFRDILLADIERKEFPARNADVTAACIVGALTEALVGPVAPILKKKTSGPAQLVDSIREVCLRAAGSVE